MEKANEEKLKQLQIDLNHMQNTGPNSNGNQK